MTKDETVTMSRELAERLLNGNISIAAPSFWAAMTELRTLLAAPVVERQEPVAWRYKKTYQKGFWAVSLVEPVSAFLLDEETHDIEPLYTSPPAPIAVVTPQHQPAPVDSGTHPHNDGLDTYRELNR